MPAMVGKYRDLPGPEAKKILDDVNKHAITAVQNELLVLGGSKPWYNVIVHDVDNNDYLDFFAGAGTSNLGYSHPLVRQSVASQLYKGAWQFDEGVMPNPLAVKLRKKLSELSPGDFDKKVFLCNSGTEANEAALKLVFNKRPDRKRIIAFEGAFHGRTGYSLPLMGSKSVHTRHFPLAYPVHHFPFPSYKGALDSLFGQIGSVIPIEDVNAVILELIQGEGGINVADFDEIQQLVSWCKENDIYLIVDEVQTGMGRTGKIFASEHYKLEPDIITLAKALSNGAAPCGATIIRADLDFTEKGRHANTNGGNMIACSAALAVLSFLEESPELLRNVTSLGKYLRDCLKGLAIVMDTRFYILKPIWVSRSKRLPLISNVRGRGLMCGVDIIVDGWVDKIGEKVALERARDQVVDECFRYGLIIEGAGKHGIRFTPPLVISKKHIDTAVSIFTKVLNLVELKS